MSIADLEERVRLAQESVEAAYMSRNQTAVHLHSYRLQKAEEALLDARLREGEL